MRTLLTIACVMLAAGCASQKMAADHGESIANNTAAQVVNPSAEATGSTAEGMEGISADDAIEQYKEADNENRGERLVRDIID